MHLRGRSKSDDKRRLVEGAPAAASELVELDGDGHLEVRHEAHGDEDAQHDETVGAHAQPVLNVDGYEAGGVRDLLGHP